MAVLSKIDGYYTEKKYSPAEKQIFANADRALDTFKECVTRCPKEKRKELLFSAHQMSINTDSHVNYWDFCKKAMHSDMEKREKNLADEIKSLKKIEKENARTIEELNKQISALEEEVEVQENKRIEELTEASNERAEEINGLIREKVKLELEVTKLSSKMKVLEQDLADAKIERLEQFKRMQDELNQVTAERLVTEGSFTKTIEEIAQKTQELANIIADKDREIADLKAKNQEYENLAQMTKRKTNYFQLTNPPPQLINNFNDVEFKQFEEKLSLAGTLEEFKQIQETLKAMQKDLQNDIATKNLWVQYLDTLFLGLQRHMNSPQGPDAGVMNAFWKYSSGPTTLSKEFFSDLIEESKGLLITDDPISMLNIRQFLAVDLPEFIEVVSSFTGGPVHMKRHARNSNPYSPEVIKEHKILYNKFLYAKMSLELCELHFKSCIGLIEALLKKEFLKKPEDTKVEVKEVQNV